MDNRKRPIWNRQVLQHILGESVNPQSQEIRSNKKTTIKFRSIKQKKVDKETIRNFSKLQNEERLFQWAQIKMDDQIIHSYSPFSYQSFENKHFYNLNRKLQNLNEVYEVFKLLFYSQSFELKNQLKQFLFYKEDLLKKYQSYESKLKKLLQLQQELQQKNTSQNNNKLLSKSKQISFKKQKIFYEKEQVKFSFNETQTKLKREQKIQMKNSDEDVISDFNQSIKLKQSHFDQENHIAINKKLQNSSKKLKQEMKFKLRIQIENKKAQILSMKEKINKTKQQKQNMLQKIEINKREKESCLSKIKQLDLKKAQIEDQNQKLNKSLHEYKQKLQNQKLSLKRNLLTCYLIKLPLEYLQNEKKRLNNQLQEMRGNIRVYCRIRPICKDEKPMNYELKSHDLLKIKKSSLNQKSQNMKTDFQFVFDRIFDQSTTQEQVFGQISQLVQSAIDGNNVCIFAYGQTGSGKTFTMQGKKQNKQTVGVIPRSIELIFKQLKKSNQNNTTHNISISVNQIYNDTLVNLMTKSNLKNGKPIFTNVTSIEQVQDQLNKAVSNRSTAFTLSNADSSRSHLIFVIKITSKKHENQKDNQNQKQSHLILVDLAGSQRVKQSGVSNQRLKEAQHINNSLSQLGQVIRSLKSNKTKTNFRNSKLTFFLQSYLQKGSKAVMFVNISPSAFDESQTINSLKFASIARQCRLQE